MWCFLFHKSRILDVCRSLLVMRTLSLFVLLIIIPIAASCSSGGKITTPPCEDQTYDNAITNIIPIAVSEVFDDGSPSQGSGILGMFSVSVDIDTMTFDIVPLRNSALTDAIEVIDITNFLTVNPCVSCVRIEGLSLNGDSNLVLEIAIKHPFPMGNPSEPVTGKNRADLIVYNVEGLVIIKGGVQYNALGHSFPKPLLVNADGYSDYLDKALDNILQTEIDMHPFILHFDYFGSGNYDPATWPATGFPPPPTIPNGNLVMGQGSGFNAQEYEFKIASGRKLDFIYAVQASYGIAALSKDDRFKPEARVPQHNKKAASCVYVEIAENNLKGGDETSDAEENEIAGEQ